MRLQANERLYFLAFDHRAAFARAVFDVDAPTAEQECAMAAAKRLIFTGVERAIEQSTVAAGTAGVLVDERYGADVALAAKSAGVASRCRSRRPTATCSSLPMRCVRRTPRGVRSGFRQGPRALRRRWRPRRQRRAGRNAGRAVGMVARPRARVPVRADRDADRSPLSTCGGDPERFERERRPELIRNAIADLQAAGVEPDVWKLEGIDTVADATSVVAEARGGVGREDVACVVLGAGAGEQRVAHWLRVAAAVEGFAGFAIGRSIWRDPVRKRLAGMIDEAEAADRIAAGYGRFVRLFEEAAPVERSPAV
jgi:myo-inositol catabolism protein IolC